MNRTIKDATVKRYFYETHDQLRTHLRDFVDAYNFGRRLKTLNGLTPFEFVCKRWTTEPERFRLNPLQQMPGKQLGDSQPLTILRFIRGFRQVSFPPLSNPDQWLSSQRS